MPMRTHELHPTLIHAPLVLLPAAAVCEIVAASSGWWVLRGVANRVGRRLWWGAAGTALVAGLTGMAAAKEVQVTDRRAQDAMFAHGFGNLTLVVGAFGLAAWRSGHRASAGTAAFAASATLAAIYTAWLGGSLVYSHGVGVKGAGAVDAPPLLSAQAPARLVKDAAGGLAWLLRRATGAITRREPFDVRAVAPGSEAVSGDFPRAEHAGTPAVPPIG